MRVIKCKGSNNLLKPQRKIGTNCLILHFSRVFIDLFCKFLCFSLAYFTFFGGFHWLILQILGEPGVVLRLK